MLALEIVFFSLATDSASASNDIGFYGLYKNDNDNEVEYYSGLVYQPISTTGNNGKLGVETIPCRVNRC